MPFVKKAYDISRKKVFFCKPEESLSNVARKMYMNNIGSIIVRKDNAAKGIITINDLLKQVAKNSNQEKITAKDIMSSPVVTLSKDLDVDRLVDEFNKHNVSRMVLTNNNRQIVGVVRDIAVYKYMSFYKYDKEVKKRFAVDYLRPLYWLFFK